MLFSLGCELTYNVVAPTTLILNVAPMQGPQQRIVDETFTVTPSLGPVQWHAMTDTGNRYVRLRLNEGQNVIHYEGRIDLDARHDDPASVPEVPVADLPLATLPFLSPSRYCLSDELARFAQREFGGLEPGYSRVVAICNWINERVDYQRGSSDTTTTAVDTFAQRAGVCRDFAHLGISFCRALGIPARFVSAYAWQLDPPDFHAIFEAWLGDRWYLFDPTRQAALNGVVRIGYGLDAADAAFATIYGQASSQPMKIWIDTEDESKSQDWTVDAISVSAS